MMHNALRQASRLVARSSRSSSRYFSRTQAVPTRSLALGGAAAFFGLLYASHTIANAKSHDDHDHAGHDHGKHAEEAETEAEGGEEEYQEMEIRKVKYLIIGGGTAAHAAVKEILANDKNAEILVIGSEPFRPYQRPPLSKELWRTNDPDVAENLRFKSWTGEDASIFYEKEGEHDPRVTYLPNKQAVDLHPYQRRVLLDDMDIIQYQKCLIATGGNPRTLRAAEGNERVTTFRDLEDFSKLHAVTQKKGVKHITVVGGGFLGSELAWALSEKAKAGGFKVTQVFPEHGVLSTVLPQYYSEHATDLARKAGIEVLTERLVDDVKNTSSGVELVLDNGKTIKTDYVVVAAGITPSTSFLKSYRLELDPANGGIVTNPEFQVVADLWAAGDVASFWDPVIGARRRIEHYEHAEKSAQLAAKRMSLPHDDEPKRLDYNYQPMFWSELGPIHINAVGLIDSKLRTVSAWQENTSNAASELGKYRKGAIYYLNKDDVCVGALLVNVDGIDDTIKHAQLLIQQRRTFKDPSKIVDMIALEPPSEEQKEVERQKLEKARIAYEERMKAKELNGGETELLNLN